ncbi:MAG: DUF839 domain-containing protein [Alphaproteobacteria bacterium]|nr:DUF839 domain-containing protein [Alphaproteobacteria bacterium]
MDKGDRRLVPGQVEGGSEAVSFSALVEARLSRRDVLRSAVAAGAVLSLGGLARPAYGAATGAPSTLAFDNVSQAITETHHVPPGYRADILIRWGDPILKGAPAFDPRGQNAEVQAGQFGFNNDFVAFMTLPRGSQASDHGLLFVNHEYAAASAMLTPDQAKPRSPEHTALEMAATGASVIEVKREGGTWRVVPESAYARRITAKTEIALSGPAAGNRRLQTQADPTGRRVLGTVNNCGGGTTPWGTVLTCEENFNGYFKGALPKQTQEGAYLVRLGLTERPPFPWFRHDLRFDRGIEPNEVNRFGWVVEVDPYDPEAVPVKRTALGRFKHEAATTVLNPDGRVVVYSADDQAFEFIYRFVSKGTFDPQKPETAKDILDDGVLSVARFDADKLTWLPLVHGQGLLTLENGFSSQADVLIEARRAASLLGATPMDRPEDVEVNPATGRVYVMLTGNPDRRTWQVDAANPRHWNTYGHVLELIPPSAGEGTFDHAAQEFAWDVLFLAGPESKRRDAEGRLPPYSGRYGAGTEVTLMNPDNCAFDRQGRLWIATDHVLDGTLTKTTAGLFACDLDGPGRAVLKFFFACPRDAELCGPAFTPDGTTLFVAVQHPEDNAPTDLKEPLWPDFTVGLPARPSIVAITQADGDIIGG